VYAKNATPIKRNMKNDFVSSARAVCDLKAHLVLCTKYRRKVFNAQMLAFPQGNLCRSGVKNGRARLIEFNGEEDHIHLLFQYYPQMDLSKFVNNIKSVASRGLAKRIS
jgi:putative transposase